MTETDISKVLIEGDYATIMGVKYKRVEEPKSPAEEAYKDWSGEYPSGSPSEDAKWGAFLAGYQTTQPKAVPVEEPTKPMNEVIDRLESKYEKKVEEETFPDEWYNDVKWNEDNTPVITDEVVNKMLKEWEENSPEFLKFELGKTLEDLITRWWCDVFTTHDDWDMETAIDDLVDQIQLWLPREQSHEGTQDASVIDLVDGYNDAIKKIKSKLRNKR